MYIENDIYPREINNLKSKHVIKCLTTLFYVSELRTYEILLDWEILVFITSYHQ